MIILLEPICYGWIHEEVNAGMLKLIDECTDDNIFYVGEEEQVKCVSKLYKSDKVHYLDYANLLDRSESDCYKNVFYYYKLIKNILVKRKPTKIIILSAYRPCILASIIHATICRKTQFIVVLHAMVEQARGKSNSYKNLFKLSQACNNLQFITFSPYCNNKYWGLKNNKIIFIHHPYIKANIKTNHTSHRGKIIGVIGACANPKAKALIARINAMQLEFPYEFHIISRFGDKFRRLANTKIVELPFERCEMESQIQEMDCVLLLYGKNEYTISASGVLWDAISNEVLCFMLNSPYFKYYNEYVSGLVVDNLEEMAEKLSDFICNRNCTKERQSDMINLDKYNHKTMTQLL